MSENQNRGNIDYAKYDSMTTEQLEELLRLDAQAPEGQALDGELLLYVLEVLAQRKQTGSNPGKTAQQAWESFQKNYLPTEEENILPVTHRAHSAKAPRHWLRRVVAAAAVLVLLICVPLTASAFSWAELWDTVAKWARETFSFVSSEDVQLTEPATEDTRQYTSLQELLVETNRDPNLVPTWIPEGYELQDISIAENPMQKIYIALYSNGEKYLKISVRSHMQDDLEINEKGDEPVEKYEVSGVTYHIFSNHEQTRSAWIKDAYECYISGDVTIEEMKTMIDSIGKG